LKEVIETMPDKPVPIEDPSWINPRSFFSDEIKEGETVYVTNHPKRSWFAQITRKDGVLKVI
jgi:hypothetical protein